MDINYTKLLKMKSDLNYLGRIKIPKNHLTKIYIDINLINKYKKLIYITGYSYYLF